VDTFSKKIHTHDAGGVLNRLEKRKEISKRSTNKGLHKMEWKAVEHFLPQQLQA
jgi:hypothetical protein